MPSVFRIDHSFHLTCLSQTNRWIRWHILLQPLGCLNKILNRNMPSSQVCLCHLRVTLYNCTQEAARRPQGKRSTKCARWQPSRVEGPAWMKRPWFLIGRGGTPQIVSFYIWIYIYICDHMIIWYLNLVPALIKNSRLGFINPGLIWIPSLNIQHIHETYPLYGPNCL